MASTHVSTRTAPGFTRATPFNKRAVGGVLVAAMAAGMMMGMLQMLVEAVSGHGFWAPLRYIASVFTRGADTDAGFSAGPVLVGLAGHMMISVILGTIFAIVVWKLTRNPIVLAILGMMWGALVYAFMWWGVTATIDPAMQLVNAQWFFVSHLVFGMVLGLGVAVAQRLSAPPRLGSL
jgi:hypothetical protein